MVEYSFKILEIVLKVVDNTLRAFLFIYELNHDDAICQQNFNDTTVAESMQNNVENGTAKNSAESEEERKGNY